MNLGEFAYGSRACAPRRAPWSSRQTSGPPVSMTKTIRRDEHKKSPRWTREFAEINKQFADLGLSLEDLLARDRYDPLVRLIPDDRVALPRSRLPVREEAAVVPGPRTLEHWLACKFIM